MKSDNMQYETRLKNLEDEMKLRGYSRQTIENYVYHNVNFLCYVKKRPLEVNGNDIRKYLLHLINRRQSPATTNMVYSALKFYYATYLKRRFFKNIPRRKREKKLPTIFSSDDVNKMLNITCNPKHRLIIMLLYSTGLRVSECINVKIQDIDLVNKLLHVKNGKGKKDRYVMLSGKFINSLKRFIRLNKIKEGYLFRGKNKGNITANTIRAVLKKAASKANINKNIYPHALRASFATSLFDNDVNTLTIQKLMGHSNLDTTSGYIRFSTTRLPFNKTPLDA